MVSSLSSRRGNIWRRLGQCLFHEISPNSRRKCTFRNPVHRSIVVIANPDARHEGFSEADEPGVAVVLAGAGFSGRKCA